MSRPTLPARAAVTVLALVALTAFYTALARHVVLVHSDTANTMLAGQQLVRGNVLLHGWQFASDSFWTLDMPLLGLASLVLGVEPLVAHLVGGVIAAALVLLGMALARPDRRDGRRNRRERAIAASVMVFVLIGLPVPLMVNFFLQVPLHIATALACLAAFALLSPDRERLRLRWGLAVALLALAVTGDPLALGFGIAPVVVAGVMVALARRHWRAAVPAVGAGALAVPIAWLVRASAGQFGGFTFAPPLPLSPASNWLHNFGLAPRVAAEVLGSGSSLAWLHGLLAIVMAGAVLAATISAIADTIRGGGGRDATRWLDDVLVLAVWADVAIYVLTVLPPGDTTSARYLIPGIVFAAVLAGRMVARLPLRLPAGWAPRVLAGAGGALVLGALVVTGPRQVLQKQPRAPYDELVAWLDARSLHDGYGAYWTSSAVTVASHDRVRARPVFARQNRLTGLAYFTDRRWYAVPDPPRSSRFLVYEPGEPWGGVNDVSGPASFGPADEVADVGPFRVLVWRRDTSARLLPPANP